MAKRIKSSQAGRTMVEAIGYISVLIMISVAAASMVNSGYYKYRLGRINQQLTDLKKVISQRYVAAENYTDVKLSTLVDEKIVPYDSKDGRHAFSGSIVIGPGDEKGTTFKIEFQELPKAVCVELGLRIWLVHDGSDLDSMNINGNLWGWEYSNLKQTPKYKLPAAAIDVTDACNKQYDNKITWYFN